jgi:membrane fusion protein, multidrug efflux system
MSGGRRCRFRATPASAMRPIVPDGLSVDADNTDMSIENSIERPTHTPRRATVRERAWLLLLAAVALSAAACARTAAQQGAPPTPKVTVAEVIAREVTEWDEFTGRLEAVNTVAIRPRVSGFVSTARFKEGAVVQRGDLLFTIDARPFQAEVDRLRAELVRARATVRRANSELTRAERLATENAMSREEQDRRASFAQESSATVEAVAAALRAAELNLEFTRVTSPITGRVGRAIVTEGNLVSSGPGEATLMATVVSIDPIYASFDADEQTFVRYLDTRRTSRTAEANLPIRIALSDDAEFEREGRLTFLDNQVDPATGTIRGRATIANKDGSLTPGLFARVRLPGGGAYRGLLIQDRAVGTDLGKRFVFVVNGDRTIEYRVVTLGPMVDGLRVVKSGLKPGDVVVVNGLQRVRPGAKVDADKVGMDAPQTTRKAEGAADAARAGK